MYEADGFSVSTPADSLQEEANAVSRPQQRIAQCPDRRPSFSMTARRLPQPVVFCFGLLEDGNISRRHPSKMSGNSGTSTLLWLYLQTMREPSPVAIEL